MKLRWNEDISFYTKEKIRPVKVTCQCGHVLAFISNMPRFCSYCGKRVYPSKRSEFKDKL